MQWLPVPSNIPVVHAEVRAREILGRFAKPGQTVIGTFGTYGQPIAGVLRDLVPRLLLDRPDRIGLVLGRGGEHLAADLCARHPSLEGRLVAPGQLDAEALSLHLQACTILVQPYPDGVSSRRGSIMAPLSHGLPIVTNTGPLSESIWSDTDCVALASGPEAHRLVRLAESLLTNGDERARLGRAARCVYRALFSVEHTAHRILQS